MGARKRCAQHARGVYCLQANWAIERGHTSNRCKHGPKLLGGRRSCPSAHEYGVPRRAWACRRGSRRQLSLPSQSEAGACWAGGLWDDPLTPGPVPSLIYAHGWWAGWVAPGSWPHMQHVCSPLLRNEHEATCRPNVTHTSSPYHNILWRGATDL